MKFGSRSPKVWGGTIWKREYDWRRLVALLGLKVPHYKVNALDYLESVGQRFCVDFGLQNAQQKAREHYAANKHKWTVQ